MRCRIPVTVLLATLGWGDAAALAYGGVAGAGAGFFEDLEVREIRLTFTDPDWWNQLLAGYDDPAQPWFAVRFEYEDVVMDPVGVRLKGNSSFQHPGVKKPFKFDFAEYDSAGRFAGLKKLDLRNNFNDPTMLREKLSLDLIGQRLPASQSVHCRLVINGEYWGLYLAAESVDKGFAQRTFGGGEDGNLFKAVPHRSDLLYAGPDQADYENDYELLTNESANDWSGLLNFIDVLNNSPPEVFEADLSAIYDVEGWLAAAAANALLGNYDAYGITANNFYLYHRDDIDRFAYLPWDFNESFGGLNAGLPLDEVVRLSPWWTNGAIEERPMCSRPWHAGGWPRFYLREISRMLRTDFDTATMEARIDALANLIRPHVIADVNKQYTDAQFEQALEEDIGDGRGDMGLKRFVRDRGEYLQGVLNELAGPGDLRLNEVQPLNTQTIPDEAGDYDPWLELHNPGPGLFDTSLLALSDDPAVLERWPLPLMDVDDGESFIVWLDGEPLEGAGHAPFAVPPGGSVYLSARDGDVWTIVDQLTVPAVSADASWGRLRDGEEPWGAMELPTPGAANLPDTHPYADLLFINEFMADNEATIEDPDEPGEYPDWIELHNASGVVLDVGGLYLTDETTDATQWMIPAGTTIAAGGFLLIWADDDPEQGAAHASFKLGASGEEIGLFGEGGLRIDTVIFDQQMADQSYGRLADGAAAWGVFVTSTPGQSNDGSIPCPGDINGDGTVGVQDLLLVLDRWGLADPLVDVDGSGLVDVGDVLVLISAWGGC